MKVFASAILFVSIVTRCAAQPASSYYIKADRVFDGYEMHEGWAVIVEHDKIIAAGPASKLKAPAGSIVIENQHATILPGLIEGHSHLFLYAYNLAEWETQVLKETDSYRTVRAVAHAKSTLLAGFTTVRDLGTEGAGYSDIALKQAINDAIVPGPRMLVAGRAIVATGAYGPKGYDSDMQIMIGAESADGSGLIRVVRDQIGRGVDVIKIYADYRWGSYNTQHPTFSVEELTSVVETARSAGIATVAHAATKEGIRRAVIAGVETIEHGDQLDAEIAKLMVDHHVFYFPTLAATESIARYKGWTKGKSQAPENVAAKRKSFKEALQSGVVIGMGGDVGVYPHGENAIEMELMNEYGMSAIDVLRAATSVNARAFHLENLVGTIKPGMKADLIIVDGNPASMIADVRKVLFVMKDGIVYKKD